MKSVEIPQKFLAARRSISRLVAAAQSQRARSAASENARLRFVQKNFGVTLLATPVIAALTGRLLQTWESLGKVIVWAAILTITCMGAILLARRIGPNAQEPAVAARKLTICGLLLAAAVMPWAAIPLFFWDSGGAEINYLIMMLEAAALPYVLATASASSRVFLPQSAPLVVALLVPPLLETSRLFDELAGLAAIYALVMYSIAFQLHRNLATVFRQQEVRADLHEQVARAKSESDAARLRAERANRAKSTFLANMSHELRTPLNAILGFSEVIKTEMLGPVGTKTYREYAADIHTSGRHLLGLITDILDLSRIEAGRSDISPARLCLAELIDDASRFIAQPAMKGGLTLAKNVAGDLPMILVDERAFRQILLNLLGNAVKFTPRGGRITVSAWMGSTAFGPAGLTLAIADTGIGIRQEDLPIVIEAFGQARAEKGALTTARHEGTGLGLSIVRGLLGAHGATFELQSEFGKGTTVLAHLPSTCIAERVPAELKSAIGM